MMKSILLVLAAVPLVSYSQYRSEVWSPDNGDGTYTNPVINADYSDPDACVGASGSDFYLTSSSFNCIPGLPILHSKDLVNWEIIGHAIKQLTPEDVFNKTQHGYGVWAPSIRYHNGEYYIYWGDPDYGVFMVKTKDPAGDWSEPVCVIPGKGMIDTTPLWDDDGRCYLVNGWAGSRIGFNSVLSVRELSSDGMCAISNPVIVFDGGNANHTTEGPKFYKRDGWYWIMCPAGGVATGWQLAMRSKSPFGPYESKIVMAQGKSDINGPHQGAWIHTLQGEDWFLHFQDKGAYGRVVLLEPVRWKENWPVIGIDKNGDFCGEPVRKYKKPNVGKSYPVMNPAESDEFNTPVLGKQWQWQANYQQNFGQPTSYGYYRLYTNKLSDKFINLWEAPNLLLQKTPADNFTVTTKIRFASKAENQYGGIIMMGMDYSALVLKRLNDVFQLVQITCHGADKGKDEKVNVLATLQPTERDPLQYQPAIYEDVYLRMSVDAGKLHFFYSRDGKKFLMVGEEFSIREGKWIGAKIGLVSEEPYNKSNSGYLDVDWFRVSNK